MFKKKKDAAQTSAPKQKKPRVYKANTKRLPVIALWVLLAGSLTFAIYKNFTAVDTHTITETTIIEAEVVDTNKIENFVFNFAKVYYAWDETSDSLTSRTNALQFYLTTELQTLNLDSVRADIATTSKVQAVQIWSVTQADDTSYVIANFIHVYRDLIHRRDRAGACSIGNKLTDRVNNVSNYQKSNHHQ